MTNNRGYQQVSEMEPKFKEIHTRHSKITIVLILVTGAFESSRGA